MSESSQSDSSQFDSGQFDGDRMPGWLTEVRWNVDGLVPVIAQDDASGQVLMFAWMDAAALEETARTGYAVYYSRSRQKRWMKGESSGHTQRVQSIRLDCDEDVILISVEQTGGIACHTGREHCFFRELIDDQWQTNVAVSRDPAEIYRQALEKKD